MSKNATKLTGTVHPRMTEVARAELCRQLTTSGIAGIYAEEAHPCSAALVADLLSMSKAAVQRAAHQAERARQTRTLTAGGL